MKYKTETEISYEPTGRKGAWKRWKKGEVIDTSLLPTAMPLAHLLEGGDIKVEPAKEVTDGSL